MRNIILPFLILGTFFSVNFTFAQKCGTYDGFLEEQVLKYPEFYESIEAKNDKIEVEHEKALSRLQHAKTENGVKIIPVVVHVIHDMGNENISDESIQGAIDILNANINGQASNFLSKTPDIFAAVRGDANIEFRLAKLDPNGEATTGINRVRSSLTNQPQPRDAVKALSYWNSYEYFNIWTLKQFAPQDDGNTLLGYAQFPWSGSMSTDGVVLLSSQMVNGGTLTHEVGHWLGLRHVWGDSDCGDDNIKDTPPAKGPNFGVNLSDFPYHVGNIGIDAGCLADSLNPAGEMFVNYMDYSSDPDVTMFTIDQNTVMNITLDGELNEETGVSGIGFREYMWSDENIENTGTGDGYEVPMCTQQASFVVMNGEASICEGESIILKGNKTMFGNGNVSSFVWDFGDGNTDASGSNFLSYTYDATGSFNVTLTVEYSETKEVRSSDLSDLDTVNAASWEADTVYDIVQGTQLELNTLGASNINIHLDTAGYSLGSYWKKNQFTIDSLDGAFNVDTFNVQPVEDTIVIYHEGGGVTAPDSLVVMDDGDSIWVYIDGNNLTLQHNLLLQTAEYPVFVDSSSIFTTEFIIDYLDSIVDYNFYYDTAVLHVLTYIDSTYLSSADSLMLDQADSSWSVDGVLNSTDSITIYFGQFNNDTTITISINTDTTSLSAEDALMFNDADSSWTDSTYIGWVDTVRTYYGLHYYTRYNGYYADTLFYRGELEKVTYIAKYTQTCTDSENKIGFVTVNPTDGSPVLSSYTYSFEDPADLNGDWVLEESTNITSDWSFNLGNNTKWQWENGTAVDGSSSIKIDRDNMLVGISTAIISKAYDLSNLDTAAIQFSWSGAAVNSSPVNDLVVTYSDDCGESWKPLGSIEEEEASNAGYYGTDFTPNTDEWRDTIMYDMVGANALIAPNVRFKIEYIVNGNSNNFYLDNIIIGDKSSMILPVISNISVSPNPYVLNSSQVGNITLQDLGDKNIEVTLISILGVEVQTLFSGRVISDNYAVNFSLPKSMKEGMYFITVLSDGNVIDTEKLLIRY